MEERGVAPCLWLKQWCKMTEKEGCLAFPEHGTFNIRILENLQRVLNEQKLPPRPAQFEALAICELMAIRQQQLKFERRMRKAEKTLADSTQRVWRREIIDGVRMFPAITQEGGTQRQKATCKTDKGSSKEKETKKSWAEADDSDDDEFLNQLLNDRLPPYALDDSRPSTSAGPIKSTQNQGTTNTVQVNTVATPVPIQNSVSVSTAPEMQRQLQPPQVQSLHPDVPILVTTTNLMVLTDPAYTRPKLIQTEPTPLLLPQAQQQTVPNYTSVTGPQLATAPIMNQNVGANGPQGIEVQTKSDDEGDDGQVSERETETTDEEYPVINFFPMFTVTDLPADLQGTVREKVWDLTGKEVGLIKGVEPVKVSVKPNAMFPRYRSTTWCKMSLYR
ncbi:hypothetical protein NDU88_003768 [Pleurodeles waltl]|uniref:Uncharacterized protein n=1 Tax=Pleurodeles waltl TaxID=8319 RepID=A0AAV7NJ26_PLEWA|nr:hypothetical protein NDU88_003768 [Pleurodeles waltl]